MKTILGIRTSKKPAYYEIITPEVAKLLLSNNAGNRPISYPKVLQYYNSMVTGKYKIGTAETLKVSNKGRLLDGQHRLTALVKANVSIEFLVARELDESIFDVIDTMKSRTASDVLSIENAPNASLLGAVLKTYKSTSQGLHERYKFSNAEIVEIYKKDVVKFDAAIRLAQVLSKKAGSKLLKSSVIGGVMLAFMEKDEDDAFSFFNQLCRKSTVENTTIEVLYQLLVKDALATKHFSDQIKIKLIIKAWNAFRIGKELKMLKYIESDDFSIK